MPILARGLRNRDEQLKRKCCVVIDNMCKLVMEPRDAAPFGPKLRPELVRTSEECATEEVRLVGAQEGIGRQFAREQRGNGRFAFRTLLVDACGVEPEFGIVRIGMERELRIRLRVFMRAIEDRIIGQLPDTVQTVPELLRFAFEHATATEREDAVADKGHVGFGKMIGDVPVRVARHVDHACVPLAERDAVAIADHAVDRGQLLHLPRRDHGGTGRLCDRLVPARMVGMPVRVPDLRDPPALRLGLTQVFRAIGRVDRSGLVAVGIVQQEAIIVVEAGELVDLEQGDFSAG